MVRLSLRALSVYGKKIANTLRASEASLNHSCSCPPGESCSVEVTELPGRVFEAVVIRPRPVLETGDWATLPSADGSYRQLFEKRATAERIRDSVASMVSAALDQEKPSTSRVPPVDDFKIVVIDAPTLRRARKMVFGCQQCSPYAGIPFDSILDRVTGHDPSVTRYILPEGAAKCPRCMGHLAETTLVEFEPPREETAFEQ